MHSPSGSRQPSSHGRSVPASAVGRTAGAAIEEGVPLEEEEEEGPYKPRQEEIAKACSYPLLQHVC